MPNPKFNREVLKQLREEKELSLREFAAHLLVSTKTSITPQTIQAHEEGRALPNADKLYAYSKFYGKPMESFFTSSSPK